MEKPEAALLLEYLGILVTSHLAWIPSEIRSLEKLPRPDSLFLRPFKPAQDTSQ